MVRARRPLAGLMWVSGALCLVVLDHGPCSWLHPALGGGRSSLCGAVRPGSRLQGTRGSRARASAEEGGSRRPAPRVGDRVRVIAPDCVLLHVPRHKEGLNPRGLVGIVAKHISDPILSANRPFVVKFKQERFNAHFCDSELEVLPPEEITKALEPDSKKYGHYLSKMRAWRESLRQRLR